MLGLPVVLFAQNASPYFVAVSDIVKRYHTLIALNPSASEFEDVLVSSGWERRDVWVISAENPAILSEPFLSCPNFNIHRAPPWYPGWGGLVRALVDRRTHHGVVAHRMVARVDAGEILDDEMFEIAPDETFLSLNQKVCWAGLALLERMCVRIVRESTPRAPRHLDWSSDKMTMKGVMKLLDSVNAPWANDARREYASSQ